MRGILLSVLVLIPAWGCSSCYSSSRTEDADEDINTDSDVDDEILADLPGDDVVAICSHNLGTFIPRETSSGYSPSFQDWQITGSISDSLATEPVSSVSIRADIAEGGPDSEGEYRISEWAPYAESGLHIVIEEDCTSASGCTRRYMAEKAVLQISELELRDMGTIAGTLSGVIMVEVEHTWDSVMPDGVTFCIDLWHFNDELTEEP